MVLGIRFLVMSMDKWLSDTPPKKTSSEQKQEDFKEQDLQQAKLEKIRKLMGKKDHKPAIAKSSEGGEDDLLSSISQFKQWLNQRTYLKGDLAQIEIWIKILHRKIYPASQEAETDSNYKTKLKEKYKDIPPNFIEEKMRIAINKKLRGMKRTSSDTYYLKKLKEIVREKLKEAKYYEILKQILEL